MQTKSILSRNYQNESPNASPFQISAVDMGNEVSAASTIVILLLLIAAVSHATLYPALYERNYYQEEIVLKNPAMPKLGLWGENNTPERGWFELIEAAQDKGTLKTTWGVILADNITSCAYDGSRLALVINSSGGDYFGPIKTTRYNTTDATHYASGIAGVMTEAMEGRTFVTSSGVCVLTDYKEMAFPTRNAIRGYHFMFPYVHVVETQQDAKWCMYEP